MVVVKKDVAFLEGSRIWKLAEQDIHKVLISQSSPQPLGFNALFR
jgi:hypothetical protein